MVANRSKDNSDIFNLNAYTGERLLYMFSIKLLTFYSLISNFLDKHSKFKMSNLSNSSLPLWFIEKFKVFNFINLIVSSLLFNYLKTHKKSKGLSNKQNPYTSSSFELSRVP